MRHISVSEENWHSGHFRALCWAGGGPAWSVEQGSPLRAGMRLKTHVCSGQEECAPGPALRLLVRTKSLLPEQPESPALPFLAAG